MEVSTTAIMTTVAPTVVCVAYSTYGGNLWSSSESSQVYARYLYTINGHVNNINKDNNITYRRVRA